MDAPEIKELLTLQTMLVALGVGMYAVEAGFVTPSIVGIVVVGFPIAVFLSGVVRLYHANHPSSGAAE